MLPTTKKQRGLRSPFKSMRLGLPLILAIAAAPVSVSQAPIPAPGAVDVTGRTEVAGQAARFVYDFDHNALADGVRAGDAVIALTASGNLLRVDARTLALTTQQVVDGRATAIALDDRGVVLAGKEDGQIAVVDPSTLALTTIGQADGAITWLMRRGGTLVAIARSQTPEPWPGQDYASLNRLMQRPARLSMFVSQGGKVSTRAWSGEAATTFFLDAGLLWFGTDLGEFGGALGSIDLDTGRRVDVPVENGVLGIMRADDGRLLAYGGTAHLWAASGFVAEVVDGRARMLRQFERPTQPPIDQSHPNAPIDRVAADRAGSGFVVLSAHHLYHASADFSTWSLSTDLGGRWSAGRRHSVGSTPTVNALLPGLSASEWLAIRGRDGIQRIVGDRVESAVVPRQLESPIVDIWHTSNGTIFLSDGESVLWRHDGGTWTTSALCPDHIPGSDSEPSAMPIADDGRGLLVDCDGTVTPGPSALVHIDGTGAMRTIDVRTSDRNTSTPASLFVGPAGRLFGMNEETLWRSDDGGWQIAGAIGSWPAMDRWSGQAGRQYVTLATPDDRTAFIWHVGIGDLLRLSHQTDDRWRLDVIGRPTMANIFDAVADRDDAILTSTPRGLFRYHTGDGRIERYRLPARDRIVTAVRDRRGRIWAAGDRLYVSSDGRRWNVVDLPMMSQTWLKRLRLDPESPDTLLLSLFDRGFVAITVDGDSDRATPR
jgi:hypothetical protein